ncbi:MAG: hypothetical protein ABI878_09530 [Acidobacteriota bacterium]
MKAEAALQAADIATYEMQKAAITWRENDFKDTPLAFMRASLASLGRAKHHGIFYRTNELKKRFVEIQDHNKYYRPRLEL